MPRTPVSSIPGATRMLACLGAFAALVTLAGCSKPEPPKPAARPPAEVRVTPSRSETIPVVQEHVGRVAAFRSVEVRARVEGILEKRHFTEGAEVRRGQLLYTIDPTPYQTVLNDARAEVARAEANLANARSRESRYAPLVKENAISRQDYDDAVTAVKQNEALLAGARSAIERAQINLGYTRVIANESGRIGATLVPEGRLVGKGEATHLTTIDRLEPVYVNFTMADRDALVFKRAMSSGEIREADGGSQARVFLPDGTRYDRLGKLDFTESQVNPNTGTISLRAVMPNPGQNLLPGMYVRVEFISAKRPDTILIPQKAVIKTPTGHIAWIVNKDGRAERRDLVVGAWLKDDWIIEKGLGAGESVIVEGQQRLQPGVPVRAVPWVRAGAAPAASSPAAAPAATPPTTRTP
ncbi:MAG: efflux RND transporter periplasmic adaptor subunit [Burkholderiales bacterium]|nr:efflux RND transporter periplasmic adaptor subunit [Burkholderiales bacterium]